MNKLKTIPVIALCLCVLCCCNKSKNAETEGYKLEPRILELTLNDSVVVTSTDHCSLEPLISVYKNQALVDTFHVRSNGSTLYLFNSKSENMFYLVSVGGSGSYSMITKVDIATKTNEMLDYISEGFLDLEQLDDGFVFFCATKPSYSDSLISYQWTDTLDLEFNFLNSSDTIKMSYEEWQAKRNS